MYTYNKKDNSYTFSTDDIENLLDIEVDKPESNETNNDEPNNAPKKIEVINGGNDLDISPVTDYLEVEKPRNEKKENIIIPEEKK